MTLRMQAPVVLVIIGHLRNALHQCHVCWALKTTSIPAARNTSADNSACRDQSTYRQAQIHLSENGPGPHHVVVAQLVKLQVTATDFRANAKIDVMILKLNLFSAVEIIYAIAIRPLVYNFCKQETIFTGLQIFNDLAVLVSDELPSTNSK